MEAQGVVAATARAIGILGDAALRTSANDLVDISCSVARATVCAGVDALRNNLLHAAKELNDLLPEDNTGRSEAVTILCKAAADLEGALGADLGAVRDAAAKLASACSDHQDVAREIQEARERPNAARSAGGWWSRIWVRRRVEDGIRTHLLAHHRISMELLSRELDKGRHLQDSALAFIVSASELDVLDEQIAGVVGVLVAAVRELLAVGAVLNSELVVRISDAATQVEGKLGAHIVDIRAPATGLVRACQKHREGEEAMAAVLRAATEQEALQGVVVQNEAQQHATNQGDARRSPMLAFGLLGCLSFITALGKGVKKDPHVFNDDERQCIFVWISLWYSSLAIGVASSSYGKNVFELFYAFLTSRVGLLGINLMTILFLYWILVIENKALLYWLIGIVVVLHVLFCVPALWRREC